VDTVDPKEPSKGDPIGSTTEEGKSRAATANGICVLEWQGGNKVKIRLLILAFACVTGFNLPEVNPLADDRGDGRFRTSPGYVGIIAVDSRYVSNYFVGAVVLVLRRSPHVLLNPLH